jgi:hypothetical protein
MTALESTSFHSARIAAYLSDSQTLAPFNQRFCLNPKPAANYRQSFVGLSKTGAKDAA